MTEERLIDYDSVGLIEASVAAAPAEISVGIDDALELHPISIRLQKDLLENLKALAKLNGLGYQPLIRQVLTRWVDCELKHMLRERAEAVHEPVEAVREQAAAKANPAAESDLLPTRRAA